MINSLANHGFLPHDGRNISLAQLQTALLDAVNLDPVATAAVGSLALKGTTTGRADTFHLTDLNQHHVLEHDGSLSRPDSAVGDSQAFNPTVWADTLTQLAGAATISIETAAKTRAHAIRRSTASNPAFNMTADDQKNSLIESALYLSVFGNPVDGNAVTKHVRVLFGTSIPSPSPPPRDWGPGSPCDKNANVCPRGLKENERLPYAEGFTRPSKQIVTQDILNLVGKLGAVKV